MSVASEQPPALAETPDPRGAVGRCADPQADHQADPQVGPETDPEAEPQLEPQLEPQQRRPALSPSRAGDFKQCPLLYRLRVVDRVPEVPSRVMVRGTVVHSVLERLFQLPPHERVPEAAAAMVGPAWDDLLAAEPELAAMFEGTDPGELADWLASAQDLLDSYFQLEDPRRLRPQACELRVEAEIAPNGEDEPVLLRGFIDRLDVAGTGEVRIVDYKTGAAPREVGEARALFQMKFYAVVLWRTLGVVPRQLRLIYLADRQMLTYTPDEVELRRFERTLAAIWSAIMRAARTGDFRPSRSRMCEYCDFHALCPEFGGTPPPYPGWPSHGSAAPDPGRETALDRAE